MPQAPVGRRRWKVRAGRGRRARGTRDMTLAETGAVGKGARRKARAPDREAPSVGARRLVGVTVVLAEQGQ